jgi:hypothetical protein
MYMNLSGHFDHVPNDDTTPLNVIWSVLDALVCWLAALACVELPRGKDYLEERKDREVVRSNPARIVMALLRRLLGFLPAG